MTQYAMLTVDLNGNVSEENRNKFYEVLKERKWKRIDDLTTLWISQWADTAVESGIIEETKRDIVDAASVAKIQSYDVALAICGKPIVWKK